MRGRARLLALGALAATLAGLITLIAPSVAMAAGGNSIGSNLAGLLREYAGELYTGIVAVFALVFLMNRRFTELLTFFCAAIVVGWLVFAPGQVADAAKAIARPGAAVTDGWQTVRSYQRIFSPERRIHQIEGRPLPVPGGVPLRWLVWATGSLVCVLALGSGSLVVPTVAAAAAGGGGLILETGPPALAAAAATVGTLLLGFVVGAVDWPIRLVVIPVAVATAATQATPDGRRPERFALSWVALRLAPSRRSLGRALPGAGAGQVMAGELWVSPDGHGPRLRRCRISGPAVVHLAAPLAVRRSLTRRRLLATRPTRFTPPSRLRTRVELVAGQTLEVRR